MKNPIEPSTISHSQSETETEKSRSSFLQGASAKFDSFFPMMDQICIKSILPMIFYYISAIYLYFQIFISSLYPFSKYWFELNEDRVIFTFNSKIIKISANLQRIAWFFHVEDEHLDSNLSRTNGETNLLIPAIIMIIIFLFSILFISIEMFGSSRLHRIRKYTFYIIRFILDIISPVMIIPTSALFGVSIRNLVISNDKINWIYLFCGFIMYVIFLLYTYVGFSILNHSTCISMTPFSSFNVKNSLLLPLVGSFFVMLQCIFSLFSYWAMVIVQLSHLALCAFVFYSAIFLSFHSKAANVMFIGVCTSASVNDLIYSILYFIDSPSKRHNGETVNKSAHFFYMAGFIFPLIFLVASLIGAFFLVTIISKLILRELLKICQNDEIDSDMNSTIANINININNQELLPLQSSKIFKTESLSLMSIHISFLNGLPIFYKWHALNYLISHFPTNRVFINIVQLLSFFPTTSRKLNSFLKIIAHNRGLSFHERFLLYQVHRIKMMRQSSVSSDANRKLADLKIATTQNYEDVYGFYSLKSTSVAYLEMIGSENRKIDSKWEEAIRDYPNYTKFCDEYCSFLLECQMDLPRAIVMKHRSNLIEMGRNFIVDRPFLSLAKNVPVYLKKEIVDYQGNFKSKREIVSSSRNSTANGAQSSVQKTSLSSGSAGSSGSTGKFSSSSSMFLTGYNLDPEFEESIGRQLFKQAILRLEMHRSLAHRKSYASLLLFVYAFFILFGGFALLLGIYIYIDGYIVERSDSMYYLNLASKVRFYIDLSILGSTLKYAYYTGRFTTLAKFNELDLKDNIEEEEEDDISDIYSGYNADIFDINDELSFNLIHRNVMVSKDALSQLIYHLATLSFQGENVYEISHIMMYSEVPFIMCRDGNPSYDVLVSLKTLQAYMHFIVDETAAKDVEEGNWFSSDVVCEIIANQPQMEMNTLILYTSLMENEVKLCEKEDKYIILFVFTLPFVPVVLYIVPVLIFTRLFKKDTEKLIKILLNASIEAKEDAKKPIQRDSNIEIAQTSEKKPKSKQWIIMETILVILGALTAVILYFMLSETKELNGIVKKLGRWNLLSSVRMTNSVEAMNYMLLAVILNGSSTMNITSSPKMVSTRENAIYQCKDSLVQLGNANEALLNGNELVPSSSGFDHQLDEINVHVACNVHNNTELHDSYRCSSGTQGVNLFISMINSVLDNIEETNGNFDYEMIYHSLHLLNRHLLGRLEQAFDRIHEINTKQCKGLENNTMITFVCGLGTTIFTFILILLFYFKSVNIYEVGMTLAQRLPPSCFLSDKKLLNFILNKKESKKETEMSTAQSAIYMSLDAIVCTNGSGIVEIINPAVTNTLGYTPDQMLGQHISSFFSDSNPILSRSPTKEENSNKNNNNNNSNNNDNNNNNNNDNNNNDNNDNNNNNDDNNTSNSNGKNNNINSNHNSTVNITTRDSNRVTNQLELMKNGQSGLVFEDHFICKTDDDKDMPCGVTILGMAGKGQASDDSDNPGGVNVESFVFIIRDETQLTEQQAAAEAAKARSENLLFHILPRDIVTRLNSGEKDISFTVQSASIIFTDIVKFSEYASGLSPQEIMGSLSTLFAAFDTCAKNYKLITKIKLIGDIYMAAAGLFNEDIQPKDHAEEILNFGLDCLTELEEVNMKLNASLQLRVGVNSGGPILAGVLGTDKPVFDIIGDPINVAARLQTTDIPGKIQIPKSTYDLVLDNNFFIEERGEVFLKGKGKSMAYLVSPVQQSNAHFEAVSSQKLELFKTD